MSRRVPNALALLAAVALGGAATAAAAQDGARPELATNPEVGFTTTLTGAAEVPGPGDTDGTGSATITVNPNTGQVCVNATTENLEPLTAMHIHEGAAGVSGPVRVDFAVTSGSAVAKCVTTSSAQAQAIIDTPAGFYLNTHTASFPNGAIRGQLQVRGEELAGLRLMTTPVRALDTRNPGMSKLGNNETRTIDLTIGADGQPTGLPVGARAAIVTVTVTQTVDGGYLTVFSNAVVGNPGTSTVNWTASNQDVAATTTVAVDGSGKIQVAAGPRGTHVIIDVIGYYG